MKKLFSIMSNLQTHCDFKLDNQNMDQQTEGNWLIYGTKDTTSTPQGQSAAKPGTPL